VNPLLRLLLRFVGSRARQPSLLSATRAHREGGLSSLVAIVFGSLDTTVKNERDAVKP